MADDALAAPVPTRLEERGLAVLARHRAPLVLLAAGAGAAAGWLTGSPLALLAAVPALFLYLQLRPAALALAAVALALAAALIAGAGRDWTTFLGLALSTGAMIAAWRAASPLGPDTERALRIVESMPGHAWTADPEGRFTYVSPKTLAFLGHPRADLDPLAGGDEFGWRSVVHPDDYERVAERWRHCLATGAHYDTEHRLLGADGSYRWFRNSGWPARDGRGRIIAWYGTTTEIDEQKQAEAALRDRERELSQLVDLVPSHLWRLTPDGEPVFFNRRMAEFLGFDVTGTDRPGMSRLEALVAIAVHPDEAGPLTAALRRSLATGDRFAMRYRLRRTDGAWRWMSSRAEPVHDQDGRIVQWYGLCHDIDDQMHIEDTLRERERFLWQLVETLPAMIDCAAPDGEPVYRSQQLRDFLGYSLDEIDSTGKTRLAATLDAGVHPDDLAGVKERYAHALATGEPYARRHRLRRFDGEYRWVETRAAPMRDAAGAIVQWNIICLDIDGEVRAEEELRLAQDNLARAAQAASLAELSASIAHEVNQPLAAIVANSNACHRWLSAAPPNIERAKVTAERIVRDAHAAAEVVSRVRALFRQSPRARASAALGDLVREARELTAEEAARRRVSVELDTAADLPPLAIDRVQIQQILVNLIHNGLDAMDETPGQRLLRIRAQRAGGALRCEVSDTGPGIADPDQVFQPFFTTKRDGMGMGLAICRSIVEAHGGRLWAEENAPHGASFVFTLPLAAEADA